MKLLLFKKKFYNSLFGYILFLLIFPSILKANIILKMQETNARTAALGGGAISFSNIISENPASYSDIENNYLSVSNNNYLSDISLMSFKYAVKINKLNGSLFVGYTAFNSGKIRNTLITSSISYSDAGFTEIYENMFAIGYAHKFNNLSLGLNSKFINSDFAGVKDNSPAVDAGFRYDFKFLNDNFSAGGVIKNIGNSFKYDRDNYKIPLLYKFGLTSSSSNFLINNYFIKFGVECIYDNENDFDAAAGCELDYKHTIFLRTGYSTIQEQGSGFNAGIGLNFNKFCFDYAWVPYSALGDAHYLSLSYTF
ncbi:PorV/PorQ family protein [Candidatus Dependentiae bacterium]|nr:PorV/PorQ family protein [Candidatus Dependentiae bacterium]